MGVYMEQKPEQKDRKKEQRQAMLKCGSGFHWDPCMGFADHQQHVPIEKVEDFSISFAAFLSVQHSSFVRGFRQKHPNGATYGFRALGPLKVSFSELPRRLARTRRHPELARQSLRHGVRSRKVLVRGTQRLPCLGPIDMRDDVPFGQGFGEGVLRSVLAAASRSQEYHRGSPAINIIVVALLSYSSSYIRAKDSQGCFWASWSWSSSTSCHPSPGDDDDDDL
ncbi:HERC2 [Symbiodinium sp. KB8]|nr:HERC2 [Symbiodinium sp. KB8]